MKKSYSKIRHIQESNLLLEKRLLIENVIINGATFVVNTDGTVSVTVDKKTSKIRFSAYYMNINIKSLSKTNDGGCVVTSKNGIQKTLTKSDVDSVINFAKSKDTKSSTGDVKMEKI